jgi:hypothetical protein
MNQQDLFFQFPQSTISPITMPGPSTATGKVSRTRKKCVKSNVKWEGIENLKLVILIAFNRVGISDMVQGQNTLSVKIKGFSHAAFNYFGHIKERDVDVIRIHYYSVLPKTREEFLQQDSSSEEFSETEDPRSCLSPISGRVSPTRTNTKLKKCLVKKLLRNLEALSNLPLASYSEGEKIKVKIPSDEEEKLLIDGLLEECPKEFRIFVEDARFEIERKSSLEDSGKVIVDPTKVSMLELFFWNVKIDKILGGSCMKIKDLLNEYQKIPVTMPGDKESFELTNLCYEKFKDTFAQTCENMAILSSTSLMANFVVENGLAVMPSQNLTVGEKKPLFPMKNLSETTVERADCLESPISKLPMFGRAKNSQKNEGGSHSASKLVGKGGSRKDLKGRQGTRKFSMNQKAKKLNFDANARCNGGTDPDELFFSDTDSTLGQVKSSWARYDSGMDDELRQRQDFQNFAIGDFGTMVNLRPEVINGHIFDDLNTGEYITQSHAGFYDTEIDMRLPQDVICSKNDDISGFLW